MAVIEINRDPTPKDYQVFALALALFFLALQLVVGIGLGSTAAAWAIAGAGFALLALLALVPAARRPLYLGWIYAFYPLGWVVSHVVLAVVYYGVFTPIGLVSRLAGRDPLALRRVPGETSAWVDREPEVDAGRWFRQF
jgi:hypothetical protein